MSFWSLPPYPGWDGLHPLVIHFPIALLLVAPIFVALALILGRRGRWAAPMALALLVIGTGFALIARETGEAAAALVDQSPSISAVLDQHEDLAEATVAAFSALTALYALILLAQWKWPKLASARIHIPVHGVFLLLLLAASVILANTGHQGGRLVHEFGIHAITAPAHAPAADLD